MKRNEFIKKSVLGAAGIAASSAGLKAKNIQLKESNYDRMLEQVGFNHIPNKEVNTMNSVYHKANSRGHANHGWLDSNHTFSFANYYNPDRMNFGVLRVLNDDRVAGGKGFGTHPHDNMEIISIPLSGDLEHQDSMGNKGIIQEGDIQVMSAGTGIMHSEYNKNKDKEVRFLQIWVFPNEKGVSPRYDQITLNGAKNEMTQILSPNSDDDGVWIHQNAWFQLGEFDENSTINYSLKDSKNGVYAFLIEGNANIENQPLEKRDGFGIWNADQIQIDISSGSKLLLMEVPMQL